MPIEFNVNHRKILEAIAYILNKHSQQAKSIFILKCLYYADKFHLQQYACPITGDAFVKLKHGPCATNAYNILQGSEIYLSDDILSKASQTFESFDRSGAGDFNPVYKSIRKPDLSVFSDSNIECLDKAIAFCMSFKDDYALSEESHKEAAWQQAALKGLMSYELMIDEDTQDRDEIIGYLREFSRSLCL